MDQRARKPVLPDTIGRYSITGVLGKGGQGVVLGALDPELERPVAIKLLRPGKVERDQTLASEARIVSQLQHPNIVTLHDIGLYRGMRYLVFEYIDGASLKSLIEQRGALSFADSVIMMSQILAGVAYLHEHGVVHRDLSPGNILLTRSGIPKVTDFGISVLQQAGQSTDEVSGTLRYMSPEPFVGQVAGPAADVFTLASIFFEMLTGKRHFDHASPSDIIQAITNGPVIDLASQGMQIDPTVAEVLARASARALPDRYPNARVMKDALDQFRLPRAGDSDAEKQQHGTVEFLLRRMTYKSGFSALSQHINELLELTSEQSLAPASRLVNVLAKDITLTQRVLSLANSAFYGKTEISALGTAVSMLGLDQVRMCVTNALLENEFEQGSPLLRDALLKSFHSAILAKALAPACALRNRAEVFTCSLFHDLGRTLTIHYFTDEFATIQTRMVSRHIDELTMSRQILGVAYHELGAGVGQQWKLSQPIIQSMRPLPRANAREPADDLARMQLCVAYANAVSRAIVDHADVTECDAALTNLHERAAMPLGLDAAVLPEALTESAELTARYATLLKMSPSASDWAHRLTAYRPADLSS